MAVGEEEQEVREFQQKRCKHERDARVDIFRVEMGNKKWAGQTANDLMRSLLFKVSQEWEQDIN